MWICLNVQSEGHEVEPNLGKEKEKPNFFFYTSESATATKV